MKSISLPDGENVGYDYTATEPCLVVLDVGDVIDGTGPSNPHYGISVNGSIINLARRNAGNVEINCVLKKGDVASAIYSGKNASLRIYKLILPT